MLEMMRVSKLNLRLRLYVLATKHNVSRVVSDSVPYKRTFKFQGNVIERGNVKKETLSRVDCSQSYIRTLWNAKQFDWARS